MPASPPPHTPPPTDTAARQAAVQSILAMARPVAALLPVDSGPDAFARELLRQSKP
ncbi:hypothetical protein [Hydrogenophaga sp. BPS33]|uniref:hypothetical protein n=1 Tax=Hydrogenophaga sp. BPS33 TaxID=2651974 RepID=UPI00135C15C5|nr:hypothetical protein [Hydrogenophaga sp. BPS33]